MTETQPMTCPDCGVAMNHHADKLDYNDETDQRDAALEGVLEQAFTCPVCGRTFIRRVAAPQS